MGSPFAGIKRTVEKKGSHPTPFSRRQPSRKGTPHVPRPPASNPPPNKEHFFAIPCRLYSRPSHSLGTTVELCHQHNLVDPEKAGAARRFGIKVSLPSGDTFRSLLGEDWNRSHWYATESERDIAYDAMSVRHGYYRKTDTPTQILIKIVR